MSLEGQKVVVVGGTGGIGLAVAQAAALQGARIVVASRSQKRCEQAAAKIEGDVEAYTVDVTDEDSIQALFDQVGFDHLVTTPGDPITFGSLLRCRYGACYTPICCEILGAVPLCKVRGKGY